MSEIVAGEVWKCAPREVKGVKRLVLARLAAYANDRRIAWVGIDTLTHETGASKSAVYEAVSWLHGRGFLQKVDPSFLAEEKIPWECVVHRITETNFWDSGCPAPIFLGEIPTPESGTDLGFQNLESDTEVRNSSRDPMSIPDSGTYKKPLPMEEVRKNTSYSSGSTLSRRSSKKSAKPTEDDYDPEKYLFSDEDLGIESQAPSSGRRAPGPDTGMGLARHFVDAVARTGAWRGLDIANQKILAATLNRWKRQGSTPDEIRSMIDIYVADEGLRNSKIAPWKDFVAQRYLIQSKAEVVRKSQFWERYFEDVVEDETPAQTPADRDPLWG